MTSRNQNGSAAATAVATTDAHGVADRVRSKHLSIALMSRRAREAAGCRSAEQLALKLDVRPWLVKRHESAAYDNAPSLDHMLAVPEYGLHLAGQVAAAHGAALLPLPVVVEMPDAQRHARITVEAADVVRVVAVHAADGRHERHELETEERELLELMVETQNRLAWVRARKAAL